MRTSSGEKIPGRPFEVDRKIFESLVSPVVTSERIKWDSTPYARSSNQSNNASATPITEVLHKITAPIHQKTSLVKAPLYKNPERSPLGEGLQKMESGALRFGDISHIAKAVEGTPLKAEVAGLLENEQSRRLSEMKRGNRDWQNMPVNVPAKFAKSAVLEDIDAGMDLVVCITEGLPVLDVVEIRKAMEGKNSRLIGPNCPGVISPGKAKAGIMPGHIHKPGPIGVVSRSGTLTYEVVYNLTLAGVGQSSCVGLGGDPVIGTRFIDVLEMFMKDDETKGIVIVGEIGGEDEQIAAEYIKKEVTKPVAGFIAGRTAPPGKRMGHAGAIISSGDSTAEAKREVLRAAGVTVVDIPDEIPAAFKQA